MFIPTTTLTSGLEGGAWESYTPVLTASVSDPTLGVGSSALGRWCRVGNIGFVLASITFGSSGAAAGSGVYRVSLPFTVAADQLPVAGSGVVFDQSASDNFVIAAQPTAGTNYATLAITQTTSAGAVTNATPFIWTILDAINIVTIAEIA